MNKLMLICILVFVLFIANCRCDTHDYELSTKFNFPHYAYKRSSKFERKFQNMLTKCESADECVKLQAHELQNCAHKCISKRCYEEIYAFDPLEDGEIDQRLNSFKGCYLTETQ